MNVRSHTFKFITPGMTDELKVPESVHHLPHRSIDRVGAADTSALAERFALASRVADGGRIIRRH